MAELLSTRDCAPCVDHTVPGVPQDIGRAAYNGACAATGTTIITIYQIYYFISIKIGNKVTQEI